MELAILAGIGLVGYYLNSNDTSTKPETASRILPSSVPNGFDIYNQNRLSVSEEKERKLAHQTYQKSQNPKQTNIIPSYYNQLGPLMDITKFKYDNINIQYDAQDDLDDLYKDMPFMRTSIPKGTPNEIFKKKYFDRDHMFLNDEYEEFRFYNKKPPVIIPGVARKDVQPKLWNNPPAGGPPRIRAEGEITVVEGFQNIPDQNLLAVSEQITDNADSLRNILTQDVTGKSKRCKRKQTPQDCRRAKRLIGVTDDYKSILVDDEIARYPSFNRDDPTFRRDKGTTLPPANYPSYLAQFEVQTFDSDGLPSAPNDIYQTGNETKIGNLEKQLSYRGGWSQYDQDGSMAYGVVPDDELIHDNMVPFYKEKYGYGSNDLQNEYVMNFKNELFTGNLKSTWNKKQEVRPFFTPVADLSYIYGTPVRPEGEESRYIPSIYRQNEKLFDEIRVTPGLNLTYDEIGTQGNFDMFRSLPKTVDELRIRTNPKISYEGRIITGLKGSERPIQAPVISYRPDGFKITTEADLLPLTDFNTGPKVRDNFIMKETDRDHQHIEYAGGAYTSTEAVGRNVPEYMREKYKYATKQNFTLPKPLQKFAKDETAFNPNLGSYDIQFNARSQTAENDYVGGANNAYGQNMYAGPSDVARTTLREISTIEPYAYTNIQENTMRGTVYPMDIANPTIRETTEENKLNPYVASLDTQQRVYYSDIARPTVRETTCDPIAPINATQYNNIYASWTDDAKMTLKETIVEIPQNTQVLAIGQSQGAVPLQDIARNTIRETTVQIPYQTMVTPVDQQQRAPNPQDIARTTTRETTVQIPYETFITPVDQQQRAPNPQDIARTTIRETTVQTPWNNFIIPVDQQQRAPNPQDIARTTIREITSQIPYETFITPVGQQQRAPNPQDIARNTIKETTVQIPYETFITPVNQQQGVAPLQDIARTTIKEITSQIPYETFITPVNQQQRAPNPQDIARNTIRETTVGIPYNTHVVAVDQGQGQAFNRLPLRPTIKETTVDIPYNTHVVAVDQGQGQAFNRLPLRTTTKETTVTIPYNTNVVAVEQSQGQASSFDRNPLRTTIKETTINNDHIQGPTNDVYAKGYGYIAESVFAPNTNRQFTCQEVYIPPAEGDVKARLYNDAYNAQIDERKDLLHWYHPPTACGVDLGPIKEQMNVYLKNDNNRMPGPLPKYSVNNNQDRPMPQGSSRTPKLMIPPDFYIDPKIIKQLDNNPYNIPYYGTHYG